MSQQPTANLSKSRVLNYLQCQKRLWLETHHPELAQTDPGTSARLQAGRKIGELACTRWPDGLLVEAPDFAASTAQTAEWTHSRRRPLFEGIFRHDAVTVRPDALVPTGDGSVDLYEVKSSTSTKDHHYPDVAVQAWVLAGAGIPVRRAYLTHIDSRFVYPGGGDYRGLFADDELTGVVQDLAGQVPAWVEGCRRVIAGAEPPVATGRHCQEPVPCPFQAHCHRGQPEFPVSLLPRGGELIDRLRAEGYEDLRQVPVGHLKNPIHRRIHAATLSGQPWSSGEAGRKLAALGWPRCYLDFETISSAIPIWSGTRPYEQVPFQWSCHTQQADGTLSHQEFLGPLTGDPYEPFAQSLIQALGSTGPVLVYSLGFERARLQATAARLPHHAPALEAISSRLVDLLPLTRESWYHPAMKGYWSIKAVLPTVAPDLDYSALDGISDGGAAADGIAELLDPATSDQRRAELGRQLREYCRLDTLALVRVAGHLAGIGRQGG